MYSLYIVRTVSMGALAVNLNYIQYFEKKSIETRKRHLLDAK